MPGKRGTPLERFQTKYVVDEETRCWLWIASVRPTGYGQFHNGVTMVSAHRWAYEHFIGSIPEGMELDHLCHDGSKCTVPSDCSHRRCVNPDHLEPVTHQENVRRGLQAARTHCPRGHEYNEANTYLYGGMRHCRVCHREGELARYHRRRQEASS